AGGRETVTVRAREVAAESHMAECNPNAGSQADPTNNVWAVSGSNIYTDAAPNVTMDPTALGSAGGSQPHHNKIPFLVVNFIFSLFLVFSSHSCACLNQRRRNMSEPFLGEIKIISWNFPPKGWTFCNGQLLPINQNQALFAILGTTYGGDGIQTFGLPNLQGRSPVHIGNGIVLGERGGETSHTLNSSEMAAHSHSPNAQSAAGNTNTPDPAVAPTGARIFAKSSG